jgi:hypothetical protein
MGADIQLPVLQDGLIRDISSSFTSFLSCTYVPYFLISAIQDEVYQTSKVMQKQLVNIPDVIRAAHGSCARVLDKHMGMASLSAWRLSIWGGIISTGEAGSQLAGEMHDLLHTSHAAVSCLLAKVGATREAVGELLISAASGRELAQVGVSQGNLPRVYRFLMTQAGFPVLRHRMDVAMCDFRAAENLQNQIPSIRPWLSSLAAALWRFPECLNGEVIVARMFAEMNAGGEPKCQILMAAWVLLLIAQNGNLARVMLVEAAHMKDDQKLMWINWMPILFSQKLRPPVPFLISLFAFNPALFLVMLKHVQCKRLVADGPYFIELIDAMKQCPQMRSRPDFEAAFEFVKACDEDIELLHNVATAHNRLYGILVKNIVELPDGFETIDELVTFCEQHPPVLRTDVRVPDFPGLPGFRFPGMSHGVVSMTLDADGTKEAVLTALTTRGAFTTFLLVHPGIHRISRNEALFMAAIAKYIHSHPSSCTKQFFCYYPDSFLVHQRLMMVEAKPAMTFRELTGALSISTELIGRWRRNSPFVHVPQAIVELRDLPIPKTALLEWALLSCEGSQSNFTFIRQSFACHLAVYLALHHIFGARPSQSPSPLFFEGGQRLAIPGFLDLTGRTTHLPLTDQIGTLLPKYVLTGSFATSWHAIMNSMWKNINKFRIFMLAFMERTETPEGVDASLKKIKKLASHVGEDMDKSDDPFEFAILDHLIDCSNNAFRAQLGRIGWI